MMALVHYVWKKKRVQCDGTGTKKCDGTCLHLKKIQCDDTGTLWKEKKVQCDGTGTQKCNNTYLHLRSSRV